MPLELEDTCVELSLPQPLLGSAPTASTILLVDCPKPWSSKVQSSSTFPEEWRAVYDELLARDGGATLIARNGEARGKALLYQRRDGQSWQREGTPAQLLAEGEWQPAKPALLVCTHGSRDSCCGRLGVPILQAARAHPRPVHECSHLGGHRFAPTLLSLPEWRFYGRLPLDKVEEFLTSLNENSTARVEWLRGAGYVPELAQVVEGVVARREGHWPTDAVLEASKKLGNTYEVDVTLRFGAQDRQFRATLNIETFRGPTSCSDVPIGLTKASEAYRLVKLDETTPAQVSSL